jgi:hypothetical protein
MNINYEEFLERVIEQGIEGARRDYSRPEQELKLAGSVAGFEACRHQTPGQLKTLLHASAEFTCIARQAKAVEDGALEYYWQTRCFEAEVEWVANVVSILLMHQGEEPIVPPTLNGLQQAMRILVKFEIESFRRQTDGQLGTNR